MTIHSLNDRLPIEREQPLEVEVGDLFFFEFMLHGSVGFGADFEENFEANTLCFEREEIEYKNPQAVEAGLCGADEARGRFYFRALGPSLSFVVCETSYRGQVEQRYKFWILVNPKK